MVNGDYPLKTLLQARGYGQPDLTTLLNRKFRNGAQIRADFGKAKPMAESAVNGVSANHPVQHAQPVKHDEKPPVREKEAPPPPHHHAQVKKKHKVDIKV